MFIFAFIHLLKFNRTLVNREIYISCLTMATGCADYTGNIAYTKDTIKLELINLSGVVCTEQNCHRFIYHISNPENKRYVILKP